MTVWTFLDNVGGVAGLWLGASVVTLLRFLIVTVPMFMHGVYKPRKKMPMNKITGVISTCGSLTNCLRTSDG